MLSHLRALRARFIRNIKSLRGTNTTRVNDKSFCCDWTFHETGDNCKLLKPELNLKKSAPSSCCFLAMSRFNSNSFSFSHYWILLWESSWRIQPVAVGALLLRLTVLYLITKKVNSYTLVSFQGSGIPLEPDGSVEADRLRILVDGQDAPAGPGGHCDIVVFIVKMYLMTRSWSEEAHLKVAHLKRGIQGPLWSGGSFHEHPCYC